jgi:hypothetical protein
MLSFESLIVNPVHFLLTENIKGGQSRNNYIILLSNIVFGVAAGNELQGKMTRLYRSPPCPCRNQSIRP